MDEQDDLTLVYMWAYKMAEKKYKSRIDQLEAALRKIKQSDTCGCQSECIEMCKIAEAALGEKKDG